MKLVKIFLAFLMFVGTPSCRTRAKRSQTPLEQEKPQSDLVDDLAMIDFVEPVDNVVIYKPQGLSLAEGGEPGASDQTGLIIGGATAGFIAAAVGVGAMVSVLSRGKSTPTAVSDISLPRKDTNPSILPGKKMETDSRPILDSNSKSPTVSSLPTPPSPGKVKPSSSPKIVQTNSPSSLNQTIDANLDTKVVITTTPQHLAPTQSLAIPIARQESEEMFRTFPKVKHLEEITENDKNYAMDLDTLKGLTHNFHSEAFLKLVGDMEGRGSPVRKLSIPGFSFERVEVEGKANFLVTKTDAAQKNSLEFVYADANAAKKALSAIHKALGGGGETGVKKRLDLDDAEILRGIDRDFNLGVREFKGTEQPQVEGLRVHVSLNGGSGRFERVENPGFRFLSLISEVDRTNGTYLKKLPKGMTFESNWWIGVREGASEESSALKTLTFRNSSVPASRKDQVAIIIYPSVDTDLTGAFSTLPSATLDSVACCYSELRFVRADSLESLKKAIQDLSENKKIGYLAFGGHGSSDGIRMGKDFNLDKTNVKELDDIKGKPLSSFLSRDAQVQIDGCLVGNISTGKSNFIDAFSEIVPDHYVWGSTYSLSQRNVSEGTATSNIRNAVKFTQEGVGDIPAVYRRKASQTKLLELERKRIEDSYNSDGPMLFYNRKTRPPQIENFDNTKINGLVDSIYNYPDYYPSGVLDDFMGRVWITNDGSLHVINPNNRLMNFLNRNGIEIDAKNLHWNDQFKNQPNLAIEIINGKMGLSPSKLKTELNLEEDSKAFIFDADSINKMNNKFFHATDLEKISSAVNGLGKGLVVKANETLQYSPEIFFQIAQSSTKQPLRVPFIKFEPSNGYHLAIKDYTWNQTLERYDLNP